MGLGTLAKYGRSEGMKKAWIIVSVVLNVVLITALYYVAFVKTDFSKCMMAKINREAYVPDRSDNGCVDSWNNCVKKLDMEVDVVFFGDSHTAGGDWQCVFPGIKSINLGYIGEDVKGMLRLAHLPNLCRGYRVRLLQRDVLHP